MRAVLIRYGAVIGVGAALLAGVLWVASTVDARPPEVVAFSLSQPLPDDERRALITTSLEIAFSEPVETDGVAELLQIDPDVDGAISWTGSTLTFTPSEPLELETPYIVTVEPGITDLAGNEMAEPPEPFTFETAGRPAVTETVPEADADDVPLDAPISIRFSTLMDTASVEAALRFRPAFAHELRWSGELLEIVPTEPLEPDRDYGLTIGEEAADVAGVALADPFALEFHTVVPGLEPRTLVPSDSTDGIATTSPIAVIFDRPIAADSLDPDFLTLEPEVAGSLELVEPPGVPPRDDGAGRILRFVPSGALPPNTTFEVELAPGLASTDGGGLAEPITWRFTTGAAQASLSNQITFLSDRSGVTNLWAMNPDGTGQRQLSTELRPVVDYALAPDGTSFVVADGLRLITSRADGSDRRVLTEAGHIEFDPAYAPDGQRIAFGRADADTGDGLGLWERTVAGGDATRIEPTGDAVESPRPSGAGAGWLRAPRYSPDGDAIAFVDPAGSIVILERSGDRLASAPFPAVAPPDWLPDSSAILVTGSEDDPAPGADEPSEAGILPLAPADSAGLEVGLLRRAGSRVAVTGIQGLLASVSGDGRVAVVDDGALYVTDGPAGERGLALADDVADAAFGPTGEALVMVVGPDGDDDPQGRIVHLTLNGRVHNVLANDGWRPGWLP